MKKNILIIGGTSGVGLKLAKHYRNEGHTVCITGRKNPNAKGVMFSSFDIGHDNAKLAGDCNRLLDEFPNVNTLVFAAGFLQRDTIENLSDDALAQTTNVGLLAPMMLISRLKKHSSNPLKIMFITSSSQYTPRELEPAYCASKAAMGMLGASLARDQEIGKVLVVAPSGMRTPFWADTNEDTSEMLDPTWVCAKIVELSSGTFKYKYAKLLRSPARVDIVSCLDNKLNPIQID